MDVFLFYYALGCGVGDGGDDEHDVEEVHPDIAIPEDDFETPEKRGALLGIALVEIRFNRAGGGECHRLAAEPGREEERADDGHSVERRHPHLRAGIALRETVARG